MIVGLGRLAGGAASVVAASWRGVSREETVGAKASARGGIDGIGRSAKG